MYIEKLPFERKIRSTQLCMISNVFQGANHIRCYIIVAAIGHYNIKISLLFFISLFERAFIKTFYFITF